MKPNTQRLTLLLLTLLFVTACMSGCANTRTVLVKPGEVIRIGPNVRGQVYTHIDGEWVLSNNRVEIPEGWYALPPE